jgi:hypothetical protein
MEILLLMTDAVLPVKLNLDTVVKAIHQHVQQFVEIQCKQVQKHVTMETLLAETDAMLPVKLKNTVVMVL